MTKLCTKITITDVESFYFITTINTTGLRLNQSSPFIEREIENILTNGIRKPFDVYKIMAWKIGAIKHRNSESSKSFVFYNGCNPTLYHLTNGQNSIELKDFAKYITNNIERLERKVSTIGRTEFLKIYKDLETHAPNGCGPVYLITLIYFISHGLYPIYDRFAKKSLIALDSVLAPGHIIFDPLIPGRKEYDNIWNFYNAYTNQLMTNFGTQSISRIIDRSLWVYGHNFPSK